MAYVEGVTFSKFIEIDDLLSKIDSKSAFFFWKQKIVTIVFEDDSCNEMFLARLAPCDFWKFCKCRKLDKTLRSLLNNILEHYDHVWANRCNWLVVYNAKIEPKKTGKNLEFLSYFNSSFAIIRRPTDGRMVLASSAPFHFLIIMKLENVCAKYQMLGV